MLGPAPAEIKANAPNQGALFYGAPEWGRANGIAKSEMGSWCLRTGDRGFFDTSTVQVGALF